MQEGLLESAELLLERGADAAAANAHGLTLLMFASHLPVEKGAAALVRLLLRHGAGAVVNLQVGRAWQAAEGNGVQHMRAKRSQIWFGVCLQSLGAVRGACARTPPCSALLHPCLPLSCLLSCRTPVDAPHCTMPLAEGIPRAWRRCWRLALTPAYPM